MIRVLITKLSSLGDLILALPAVSDAVKALPDVQFDWVVDQNFQEIPLWHPAVENTFVTNHRIWRKKLTSSKTRKEFSQFYRSLKSQKYDLIIDAQGNIKSALLSLIPEGKRAGFDGSSTPEWGSQFFYGSKYRASKELHAIDRLRILFAGALNYALPETLPNYQIDVKQFQKPDFEIPNTYLMFVPIASYNSKLWPESLWKDLIQKAVQDGHTILIPWGNQKEKERAERLRVSSQVKILPRLTLNEIGYLVERAKALVSVDTGLSHMAAALSTPCITLYGPTDPNITGTVGENQFWIRSSSACNAGCKKRCALPEAALSCMKNISATSVWEQLRQILRY